MAEHRTTADPLADVSKFVAGDYLKTSDVKDGDLTFGITHIEVEMFEAKGDRKAEKKIVLILDGDPPRKLSLNQTNLQTLMDAWGKDARSWIGKAFDAYYDGSVRDPSGKRSGGIRVRVRELPGMAAPAAAKPKRSGTAAEADPIPF